MNQKKEQIREKIKHNLNGLTPEERLQKSKQIHTALFELDHFKRSRCVLIYISLEREVDTHAIIEHCFRTGKQVAVPRVNPAQGALEIREITSWDGQLEKGTFGVMEPREDRARLVDLNEIDCVVVPGVAFDHEGRRLGHGQGYYDRLLSRIKPDIPRIALAFDVQLIDHLPQDSHDQPVHTVLSA